MADDFPYLAEGVVAENGIVYAGAGHGFSAYKISDGERIWTNSAWRKNEGATATLTLGGGVLVASGQWGGLYGHDASTGELLWKHSSDGLSDRGGSAVYKEGKFYIISGKSLFTIEPRTGEILSRNTYPDYSLDVASSPVFTGKEIVFGTAASGLLAVNPQTFGVKWNYITGTSLVFSAPYTTRNFATVETSAVVKNGILVFGASDGCLYGLKAGTGEEYWKFESGAPSFCSPALSGNLLVAADFAGNVYAFRMD